MINSLDLNRAEIGKKLISLIFLPFLSTKNLIFDLQLVFWELNLELYYI